MSVKTLQKIDALILNISIGDESSYINVSNPIDWEKEHEYFGDDWYWLNHNCLPSKIFRPQIVSLNSTFLIIGSENNQKCYIYNNDHKELKSIDLENEFPKCAYQQNARINIHKVLDIYNNIKQQIQNKDTKTYLMFGNNGNSCFMVECTYNIKQKSMKFYIVTNKFNMNYLSNVANVQSSFI
eukprot:520306_1